ncbi:class I SAM-dependent DNA methyltransferase [Verrucosispora sp. TAA-831]|uniref:class I SAM-dependent DNA methyltransferase n=1 Tax=Verrucosispora sp. TAA-831 TaxID=3422227 RepID=UPI003D701DA3
MSVFDDPGHFGRFWADTYDLPGGLPDPMPAAAFLADLAGDGRALELAIGTGRVALPLAAHGCVVEGVEASPEMVAQLRGKPGGVDIPVSIGDMADVPGVTGPYRLVFLVFNTLFNLTREERQADCFRNVARVLEPGGTFVIETYVPDPADIDRDEQVRPWGVAEDSVAIRVHRYDREAQTFLRQTVTFDGTGVHLHPFAMRYMWPEQIDEMARQAGFHLAERYADWDRSAFGPDSTSHVSVYRLG